MKIEEALAKYVGQDVLVYTAWTGSSSGGIFECTITEVGDGWLRIEQGDEDEKNESILNIANVIRVREYPRRKNGKKKIIFE